VAGTSLAALPACRPAAAAAAAAAAARLLRNSHATNTPQPPAAAPAPLQRSSSWRCFSSSGA
jgi:hypothetical protein